LHPIGADNLPRGIVLLLVLDEQVLADVVELVGIQSGLVRTLQTLSQFNVEHSESQAAGGDSIFARMRHA